MPDSSAHSTSRNKIDTTTQTALATPRMPNAPFRRPESTLRHASPWSPGNTRLRGNLHQAAPRHRHGHHLLRPLRQHSLSGQRPPQQRLRARPSGMLPPSCRYLFIATMMVEQLHTSGSNLPPSPRPGLQPQEWTRATFCTARVHLRVSLRNNFPSQPATSRHSTSWPEDTLPSIDK